MKFAQVEEHCFQIWKSPVPSSTILLLGPPGIGKTSVGPALVKRMGPKAHCEIKDLTSIPPEDLPGMPWRSEGDNTTKYAPQEWLQRFALPGATGVLILDDLPAASPNIAAATRQIALDRRINGVQLSDGVIVLVTGNRGQDQSGAIKLPSHFLTSVCNLQLEPDLLGWGKWFLHQGGAFSVMNFLKTRPQLFSQLPKDADNKGSFATPRTWTMLSKDIPAAEAAMTARFMMSGFVGDGVASEFRAYQKRTKVLPPLDLLMEKPRETLPEPGKILTTADLMIGATDGIAFLSALENNPKATEKYLEALFWVSQHNNEYVAASLATFSASGGSSDQLHLASARLSRRDPLVAQALKKMAENLRG